MLGSNGKKPTTETILDQLKNTPLQNIVVHVGETKYLISLAMVKFLAWKSIPDMIKDENSEDAKKNQILRTGIKTLIRPLLPQLLRQTWGEEVEVTPRLNILTWLSEYFVHLIINLVASREWNIHVERCELCGENVFKIIGISPKSDGQTTLQISAPSTPDTHSQPLQGGG